jgi:hypothetical protein
MFLLMFLSTEGAAVELVSPDPRVSEVQSVLQDLRAIQDLRATTEIGALVALRVFLVLQDSEEFKVLLVLLEETERMGSLVPRELLAPLGLKVLLVLLERLDQLENEDLLVLLVLPAPEVYRVFRDQPVRLDLRD